jgi:hypothetical protein
MRALLAARGRGLIARRSGLMYNRDLVILELPARVPDRSHAKHGAFYRGSRWCF